MSMQGSLESFSILDLFGILQQLRKTGVLTAVTETEERGFLFSEGSLVYATTQDVSKRLGSYLVRLGFISEQSLEEMFESNIGGDSYFGQRIIDRGHVNEKQLAKAVCCQLTEILLEVVNWERGAFYFDDTPLPFDVPDRSRISVSSVVFDIARKRDERDELKSLFPDENIVYARLGDPDRLDLTDEQLVVLGIVDGTRTIEQVLFDSSLSSRVTAEVLGQFVEQRIVVKQCVRSRSKLRLRGPDMKSLPVCPEAASRLFEAFNFETSRDLVNKKVKTLVSRDPLLCAKILKMMNLGNHGACRSDLTLDRMVDLLGTFQIRCNLLPEATRGFLFPQKDWIYSELWSHSHLTAILCREIAKSVNYSYPDEAYLVGLLHNLGAFLLLHHAPQRYVQIISKSMQTGVDIETLEEEAFGITHTRLGGKFAEKWLFPPLLTLGIRNHHNLGSQLQSPLLYILCVATCVLQQHGARVGFHTEAEDMLEVCLLRLNLGQDQLEDIYRTARREADGVATVDELIAVGD